MSNNQDEVSLGRQQQAFFFSENNKMNSIEEEDCGWFDADVLKDILDTQKPSAATAVDDHDNGPFASLEPRPLGPGAIFSSLVLKTPRLPLTVYNCFFAHHLRVMVTATLRIGTTTHHHSTPAPRHHHHNNHHYAFAETIAQKWRHTTEHDKEPFRVMAKQDKKRYKRELRAYHRYLAAMVDVPSPALPDPNLYQEFAQALRGDEIAAFVRAFK